jgi:hypothetical protein
MDSDALVNQLSLNSNCGMVAHNDWLEREGSTLCENFEGKKLRYCLWLPVPRGGESPWKMKGSRCLSDFRSDSSHWQLVSMLQFLLLCTELTDNGTPTFTVDANHSPHLFRQVVERYCRCFLGVRGKKAPPPQQADFKYVKDHMKPFCGEYDPEMVQIIEDARKFLEKAGDDDGDGEDNGDTFQPNVVRFEPMPEDPMQRRAWIERCRVIIASNPDIRQEDIPEALREENMELRREEESEEHRHERGNLDRIARWIASLDNVSGYNLVIPLPVTTEDSVYSEAYIPKVWPKDNRRSWPVEYCENPPVDLYETAAEEEEEEEKEEKQKKKTNQFIPKVHVTWFVLDEKNSLFRFAVYDPMFSLDYVRKFLQSHPPGVRATKKPWENGNADPLAHLRHFGKMHIANTFSETTFEEMLSYFLMGTSGKVSGNYLTDESNPAHLKNVLTLRRALSILKACTATHTEPFEKMPLRPKKLHYTKGILATFTIHPRMCFWYGSRYLGLGFTLWPYEKQRDNYAMRVIQKEVFIENGELKEKENIAPSSSSSAVTEIKTLADLADSHKRRYLNPLVDKQRLEAMEPRLLSYRTGDQIMKWQKEQETAYRIISQLLSSNPGEEPARYAMYCKAMKDMRDSCLDKFCSIWLTDGMVATKPIAPSIKAILKFLADHLQKGEKKTLTCKLPFLDDEMTCFGNLCINRMVLYKQAGTIINCIIPFLASGLMCTWDKKRPGIPKWHIILCGAAQTGKSYPLLGYLRKILIAGTYVDINSKSNMANYIDGHIGPRIALCDEPPKFITSAKEEDKHYEAVQETKAVLTEHQHNRTILKQQEVDGDTVRVQVNLHTDDATTWAFCTNQPREKDHPLGSRLFQMTVPKPTHAPEESNFEPGAALANDAKTFFNIEQVLVVEVYTALTIGVIPDVDMWLFNTIIARVYTILRNWNLMGHKGDRSRQIIESFARHMVILRGITACRHIPGGVLYNVPYDPADVYKIGPYLVCTLEIVFMALHCARGEIIDEDSANTIKAACKMTGYDINMSGFANYKNQKSAGTIPFKSTTLKYNQEDTDQQHLSHYNNRIGKEMLDLNYLEFEGTLQNIAARIASYTNPPLETFQVEAVLATTLKNKSFSPIDGKCYRVDTKSRMESWIFRGEVFHDNLSGEAIVATEQLYQVSCDSLVAVEIDYSKKPGKLYLCPSLVTLFDIEVIERAFNLAAIHAKFPQIKAIKGLVYDEEPDLFKVANWNKKFIDEYVRQIDTRHPDAPVMRKDGIAISTKEMLSDAEQNMLLSVKLDPNRKDHKEAFENVIKERNTAYRKYDDLELEAAKRVAWRCGTPLDEIVYYTDSEIRRQYDKYCVEHPEVLPEDGGNMRYPISVIRQRKENSKQHKRIANQMCDGKDIRISSEYTVSDAETFVPRIEKKRRNEKTRITVAASSSSSSSTGHRISASEYLKNI